MLVDASGITQLQSGAKLSPSVVASNPRARNSVHHSQLNGLLLKVALFGFLAFTVAGCGSASDQDPYPYPTPSLLPTLPTSPEVEKFNQDCSKTVQKWRPGQVDYPFELNVSLHDSTSYNAAVDVRKDPLPPDQVIRIDNGTAGSEEIFVQCRISARLIAVGDGITVTNEADGWVSQKFTPSGVVKWSWSFTADKPNDQQLKLELRPAILVEGDSSPLEESDYGNQAPFITRVVVEATMIETVADWFDTQWPLLVGVAVVVGGAVLAVKKWVGSFSGKASEKTKKNV